MILDVGLPVNNLLLNASLYALLALAAVSLLPWGRLGAGRFSRLLRWSPVPAMGLGLVYEAAMPAHFDIRLDLLLLLPAYGVILLTSVFRWLGERRRRSYSA